MSSVIYFRMKHGKEFEPIHFDGHQIRLLDLKRAMLELKQIKSGVDFDLHIVDSDNDTRGKESRTPHFVR